MLVRNVKTYSTIGRLFIQFTLFILRILELPFLNRKGEK